MGRTPTPGEKAIATNRKAFFNYEVLDRLEAGISLVGTEVKSIREGGLNFRDSFVEFRGGELFLVGCRIGPYSHGNLLNHPEDRDRKLLLHKREALKFGGKVAEKGYTITGDLTLLGKTKPVTMPANVVVAIKKMWTTEIKDASGKPLFTASN